MILDRRNIFLFDSVDAIVSAFLQGLLLPTFSFYIGLPKEVHYFLALFPLVYMINSFFYFFK